MNFSSKLIELVEVQSLDSIPMLYAQRFIELSIASEVKSASTKVASFQWRFHTEEGCRFMISSRL